MNRLKTGVPGLDELIEGGFPEGSSVLLSGAAGTGKSICCMQYLYYGAKEEGQPGVYITLEEGQHNLWWNMQRFKWDILPLQQQNLLQIYKFEPGEEESDDSSPHSLLLTPDQMPRLYGGTDPAIQIRRIVDKAREIGARRMVIDSISAFTYWYSDEARIRKVIYRLVEELRNINCTTILSCEVKGGKRDYSMFGVEEFLVDGLVMLYFFPPNRSIFVRKMRGTDHSKSIHPMQISETGLAVSSKEEVLWEAIKD
ncbi:AAA family ATPase [Candidatus Micrarchaeota archaeon]|nr:AAA family ATPase [Candidatus Micrarchaeota archaeon]MBI5176882.1 AAA family ATPase [Candidatus Micrarchaeota archaeon]